MRLIIDIPEDVFKRTVFYREFRDLNDCVATINALEKAVQLPKGHGDLKDANKLKHAFIKWSMAVQGNFTDADIASIIYNSPTIVKADKESEK